METIEAQIEETTKDTRTLHILHLDSSDDGFLRDPPRSGLV